MNSRERPQHAATTTLRDQVGRRAGGDRGIASLELAITAPILIFGLLLLSFAFVVTANGGQVSDLAAETASAASRADRFNFQNAAATEASRIAAATGLPCTEPGGIAVTTAIVGIAGTDNEALEVTVQCTIALGELGVPGAPGSHTFVATRASSIDRWRGE